jgi:predicted ArsR family transcriptional regulator
MPDPVKYTALNDAMALRAYAHPVRLDLIGALRREGPLTATQAAALIDQSVPTCSFHLRQLAKYGLVERVPGADARERPWRSTAEATRWGHHADDPEIQAAVDELDAVVVRRYYERALRWLERRGAEPPEWRAHTGPADALLFLTADELGTVLQRMEDAVAEFRPRHGDPSLRPPGARTVSISQYVMTLDWDATPEPAKE